ncbi:MAG: S8 family serine peptidase, partial [candidate division Zixibacteria bacterium]|nr:S8 family serine peptidase [candidate division Zixibacteria bacterium]
MKTFLTVILVVTLFASGTAFTEQVRTLEPRKHVDVPSFLGNVPDRFIVVLKDDVTVDHRKDARSPVALGHLAGFDALARKFQASKIRPQFPSSDRGAVMASAEGRKLARYYKVTFNSGTLEDAMAAYEANPMVDHVEPIGIHTFYATPNDPYYDDPPSSFPHDQWHYWDTYGVDADLAWDANTGDATVVIGVLDSGIKYDHGDLGGNNPPGPNDNSTNGNVWVNSQEIPGDGLDNDNNGYVDDVIGWDFVERSNQYQGVKCIDADCGGVDNDPFDGDGHGTHVAGTIAAITNNGYCVAGVAGGWGDGTFNGTTGNGVKVVALRIGYRARWRGYIIGPVVMDYVAEAMYYMADLKIRGENVVAVNCSFGNSNTGGLGAAVDYLLAQGVMVIVAAGNDNSSDPDYLGEREDCLDVGGTAQDGGPYSGSNYGPWVDLAAPGVDVMSTTTSPDDPGADYIAYFTGTSMSCPHVVGTAALLKSCDPTLTPQQIWDILVSSTTPYSGSKDLGSGIVNAKNALDSAGCTGCDLVPNFSGTPTSGCAPLNVSFTDQSTGTGINSWYWEFGDGGASTAQNPTHPYN